VSRGAKLLKTSHLRHRVPKWHTGPPSPRLSFPPARPCLLFDVLPQLHILPLAFDLLFVLPLSLILYYNIYI
jgi:hypothetical protein